MKIRRIHFAGSALVMPSRERTSRGVRRVSQQSGLDGRGGCALSECEAVADLPAAGAVNGCEAAARCFGGAFVAMLMETLGCRCLDDCIAAGAEMERRRGAGLLERDDGALNPVEGSHAPASWRYSLAQIFRAPEHRVAQPLADGGFAPARAAGGDADLSGEGAGLDLAIERRPAETGAIKDSAERQYAVGRRSGHGSFPNPATVLLAPSVTGLWDVRSASSR
jgi:hypothetical protein